MQKSRPVVLRPDDPSDTIALRTGIDFRSPEQRMKDKPPGFHDGVMLIQDDFTGHPNRVADD